MKLILSQAVLMTSLITFNACQNNQSNALIESEAQAVDVDTTPVEQLISTGSNYQWYSNDQYLLGLKDRDGNILVEAQFDCVGGFYDGWAAVWNSEFSGFCDTLGNLESLPPGLQFATYFSEMGGGYYFENEGDNHYVIVNETKDKYGFINSDKKIIVEPKYDHVFNFREGLAVVSMNSLYGYIDTNGVEIIPIQYRDAKSFSEGLAGVQDTSTYQYGFINSKNEVIIEPMFYSVTEFVGGFCIITATSDSQLSFINKKGNIVIEGPFEDAQPFWSETTLVQKNGKCYYINKKGKKTEDADCDGFLGC